MRRGQMKSRDEEEKREKREKGGNQEQLCEL